MKAKLLYRSEFDSRSDDRRNAVCLTHASRTLIKNRLSGTQVRV